MALKESIKYSLNSNTVYKASDHVNSIFSIGKASL